MDAVEKAEQNGANLTKVIAASCAGTLIEWYDFYLFGSLAAILAGQFFPKSDPNVAFLSTLATFATGFVVRPFGALVFGRMGDLLGRKVTFLLTLGLMGGSTFAIGLLPGYDQIGVFAPIILVLLRLVQGLALGGEYGGAATYIAEFAPANRRGFYTSFVQTTATVGFFITLGVIMLCNRSIGKPAFDSWGWRVPFLLSIVLIIFSYIIRSKLAESPLFQAMKAKGTASKSPLKESFADPANLKLVMIALFGVTMGQGVVWYTGQFFAHSYLQKIYLLDLDTSSMIVAIALLLATPFFLVFGALSDKIGRRKIILSGMALAAISYIPIYMAMGAVSGWDPAHPKVPASNPNFVLLSALIFVQVFFVTMVYGPIAAWLVEIFPTRIRYTSMSLPYHIGNGVFGGLVPFIGMKLATESKTPLWGLSYTIAVAAACCIIGLFFMPERHGNPLDEA